MTNIYLTLNKLLNNNLKIKLKNKLKKNNDPLKIYEYINKIIKKYENINKKIGGNLPHPNIYNNNNNYIGGNVPHPDIYNNNNNYIGGNLPHPSIYNENYKEDVDFFSSDSDLNKGIIRQGGNTNPCNCENCKKMGGCNKCKSGGCQKIKGGYSSDQLQFAIEQNIKLINRYENHLIRKIIYDKNTKQITEILESPVEQITIPKLSEDLEILFNSLNLNDRNIEGLKMRTIELINEYNREIMNIKNGGNKNINKKLEKNIIEYIKTKKIKINKNIVKEISKKIIYHINYINEKNKILILK
jgi:hypothetical protein